MTSALALLSDLAARGVRLAPRGDRLHVNAPAGTLTPALRETLTREKPALLAALRDPRRSAYRAWEAALSAVADAWDRHAAEARARGQEPAWINDDMLTADVREKIRACRSPEDLAPALEAVETWRRTWEETIAGGSPL